MFEFVIMVNMIVYHEPVFKVGEVIRIEGLGFTNRDDCEDELMQMYLREQEYVGEKDDVEIILQATPTQMQIKAGSVTTVRMCMSSTEAVVPLK